MKKLDDIILELKQLGSKIWIAEHSDEVSKLKNLGAALSFEFEEYDKAFYE